MSAAHDGAKERTGNERVVMSHKNHVDSIEEYYRANFSLLGLSAAVKLQMFFRLFQVR